MGKKLVHTIIIKGGLGNQLFQIFALISYCIDNDANYALPKNMLNWDKRHPYWDTLFKNIKSHVIINAFINNCARYQENGFEYNKIINFNTNTCLDGYFQSEKYFKENFSKICDIIDIFGLQSLMKEKLLTENNISLHFRMGDFGNPDVHPIIPDIYYIKSIQSIIKQTGNDNWNIYYACEKDDDSKVLLRINNIKQHFEKINFIKISNDMEDWEQMILMSCCDHNIIANSTFSWWSGYLNNNKSKIVTYPSLWFGPAKKLDRKDLIPEKWHIIDI